LFRPVYVPKMGTHMQDITPPTDVSPVQEAREAIGLSREGLAFKAHVSVKTIERIERFEGGLPHRATRQAIARVLRCKPADLGWPEEIAA
jgi:transcriptional regulator with XRE-family HTH domain